MKEIIKHGNTVRKFKCHKCGCKFKASETEYSSGHSSNSAVWVNTETNMSQAAWEWVSFQSTCPECGTLVAITLEGEDVVNDYNNRARKPKRSS